MRNRPMSASRRRLSIALLWALVAVLAGCNAPEVSETFDLVLPADAVQRRVGGTWRVAQLGRVAMDWRVTNTGSTTASFTLLAQAQTSGDVLDGACESLLGRTRRIVASPGSDPDETAPDEDVSIATISALGQPFLVGLSNETHSWLRIRVSGDSTYRLATSSEVDLEVYPANGELPLAPRAQLSGGTACPGIDAAWEFSMFAGDYNVRFQPGDDPSIRFLVEEKCESVRDVGRTCPGAAGSTREITVGSPMEPGASETGRMGVDLLGVGDQITVELRCTDPDASCEAMLELAIVNETLDCRDDDNCRGARSCSEEGYCLATESGGCSAASRAAPAAMPLLLGVVALLLGRRRQLATLVLASTVCSAALLPNRAAASETGGQVYTEVGVSSYSFAGRLGVLTSPGIGVELSQGLQFGLIGAQMSVGTSYYLTRQQAPPHAHLLQTFQVVVGPRISIPLKSLRFLGSTEYVGTGFLTNALAATTGPRTLAHGVGASVAARFEGALPLYAEVRFGARSLLGLDIPATSFGFTVTFGIAGTL